MLVIPYNLYDQTKLLIEEYDGKILDEEFAADVTLSVQFLVEKFESFAENLRELSHGRIQPEIIETNPKTLFFLTKIVKLLFLIVFINHRSYNH